MARTCAATFDSRKFCGNVSHVCQELPWRVAHSGQHSEHSLAQHRAPPASPGPELEICTLAAPLVAEAVSRYDGSQNAQTCALLGVIWDDTPELALDHMRLFPEWLLKVQQVFRNAFVMCDAAHLHTCKKFDQKVFDLTMKKYCNGSAVLSTQHVL